MSKVKSCSENNKNMMVFKKSILRCMWPHQTGLHTHNMWKHEEIKWQRHKWAMPYIL